MLCELDYFSYVCRLWIGYDGITIRSGVRIGSVLPLDSSIIYFTKQLPTEDMSLEDIMSDMSWFDICKKEIPIVLDYYYDLINEYAEYYRNIEPVVLNQGCYIKVYD